MKRTSRTTPLTKDYLVLFVIALVILGTSIYVVIPQVQRIVEGFNLLNKEKEENAKLVMKRNVLEAVDADFTDKYLADAELTLPQEKDAAGILISLENLSASSQVSIEQISLTPGVVSTDAAETSPAVGAGTTQDRHGAKSLTVEANIRGTTAQFLDFIGRLQNSRRIFDISKLQVRSVTETQDFVTADLTLQAYFLPAPTQLDDVSAPLPQITPAEEKTLLGLSAMPVVSTALTKAVVGPTGGAGKQDLFQP